MLGAFARFEAVYMLVPGWVVQMKAVRVRMSHRTTSAAEMAASTTTTKHGWKTSETSWNIKEEQLTSSMLAMTNYQILSTGMLLSLGSLAKVVNTGCSKERWIFKERPVAHRNQWALKVRLKCHRSSGTCAKQLEVKSNRTTWKSSRAAWKCQKAPESWSLGWYGSIMASFHMLV